MKKSLEVSQGFRLSYETCYIKTYTARYRNGFFAFNQTIVIKIVNYARTVLFIRDALEIRLKKSQSTIDYVSLIDICHAVFSWLLD